MNRNSLCSALCLASYLVSSAAMADDPLGLYLGAGLGSAQIRHEDYGDYDDYHQRQDFGWKAIVGIRPISLIGAEVEYIDFGDVHDRPNYAGVPSGPGSTGTTSARAPVLFAVGYLPLPVQYLDVYGKAGVARLNTRTDDTLTPICGEGTVCTSYIGIDHENRWSTDFAYGAGAQFKFGALALRAEYERIDASRDNPDLYSFAATWTF